MNKKMLSALVAAGSVFLASVPAQAARIYANSAGNSGIQVFDVDVAAGTETKVDQLNVSQSNGRGVVAIGDTVYYTDASSGFVKSYTLSSHTDNGNLFAVAGASGLATIAYDGASIYFGDYSGTSNVYKTSLTGTPQGTISLAECGIFHNGHKGFCDGLEFANGGLISNNHDGGFGDPNSFDTYSLAGGASTQVGFITTSFGATGIAYDGTNYFVSAIGQDRLAIYDNSGTFLKFIALTDGLHTNAIEDLSVDYSLRVDTGGAPEPSTWLLLLSGIAVPAWRRLRRA